MMKAKLTLLSMAFVMGFSCVNPSTPNRKFADHQVGHAASGILFPQTLGEFQRTGFQIYDDRGLDVGATYLRFHVRDRISAQLSVYPAPPLHKGRKPAAELRSMRKVQMKMAFDGVKQRILDANPGSIHATEDASVVILFGQECDVQTGIFLFTEDRGIFPTTYYSSVSMVAFQQWFLVERITATIDAANHSEAELVEFVQAFMLANEGTLLSSRDPRNN
ncbi:MAG: hypothetical protein QM477_08395 [Planctomycetota bacterium]